MTSEVAFHTEVLKLLIQVAWADDELHESELDRILRLGQQWGVPEAVMTELHAAMARKSPLPAPDLSMLRTKPAKVLAAARALTAADGVITEDELEFLAQLEKMLSTT